MAINLVPLLWIGSLLTEMAPFAALQLSFPCLLVNEWHTLIQVKSCIYSVTSNETLRRIITQNPNTNRKHSRVLSTMYAATVNGTILDFFCMSYCSNAFSV